MAGAVIAMAQTWHVGPVAVKFGPLGRETCVMGGLRWFSVMGGGGGDERWRWVNVGVKGGTATCGRTYTCYNQTPKF